MTVALGYVMFLRDLEIILLNE